MMDIAIMNGIMTIPLAGRRLFCRTPAKKCIEVDSERVRSQLYNRKPANVKSLCIKNPNPPRPDCSEIPGAVGGAILGSVGVAEYLHAVVEAGQVVNLTTAA